MLAHILLGFLLFALALVVLRFWNQYVQEGFAVAALNVPTSAFVPSIAPGGIEPAHAMAAPAMNAATELLLSDRVPVLSTEQARAQWGALTSQRCLAVDAGEPLKPVGSFSQRTNNYRRRHPDDCSAPRHELIGTFYAPVDGVGK
jgi:hypothetical protein